MSSIPAILHIKCRIKITQTSKVCLCFRNRSKACQSASGDTREFVNDPEPRVQETLAIYGVRRIESCILSGYLFQQIQSFGPASSTIQELHLGDRQLRNRLAISKFFQLAQTK